MLIHDRFELRRLTAIWQWPEDAEEGGPIAYGPRRRMVFRQRARQVAKLLRGANVADVPVEQPTGFELIINLRAAKMLGVKVLPALLSRAKTARSNETGTCASGTKLPYQDVRSTVAIRGEQDLTRTVQFGRK